MTKYLQFGRPLGRVTGPAFGSVLTRSCLLARKSGGKVKIEASPAKKN